MYAIRSYYGTVPIDIAEQTLFETSFVLDDVYYERMQISPFFLPYLGHLYQFAKTHGLAFTVGGMQGSTHFVPVFVGDDLRVKTFGQGGKVLIFEPDLSLLLREIDFIRSEAKWAKIIYLLPASSAEAFEENEAFLLYETVITSYSIHYTKLYEKRATAPRSPTPWSA